MKHYRQGDLLFVALERWPAKARRHSTNVLGEGEKPGHRHVLEAPGQLYIDGKLLVFGADTESVITHPEHKTLTLPPGRYRVVHQQEYRPTAPVPVLD